MKLNPIYKARDLINMLYDKLTGRGKINTDHDIFKCLAFKCYLKGISYYAYMLILTHQGRIQGVASVA